MDLTHTWTKQHFWPNRHVLVILKWPWSYLTDKARFFSFALIALTFSFIAVFNSYLKRTTLIDMLYDFHVTLTFIWSWPTSGIPFINKQKQSSDAPTMQRLLLVSQLYATLYWYTCTSGDINVQVIVEKTKD